VEGGVVVATAAGLVVRVGMPRDAASLAVDVSSNRAGPVTLRGAAGDLALEVGVTARMTGASTGMLMCRSRDLLRARAAG
jgi:hypothetical protein